MCKCGKEYLDNNNQFVIIKPQHRIGENLASSELFKSPVEYRGWRAFHVMGQLEFEGDHTVNGDTLFVGGEALDYVRTNKSKKGVKSMTESVGFSNESFSEAIRIIGVRMETDGHKLSKEDKYELNSLMESLVYARKVGSANLEVDSGVAKLFSELYKM